MIEAIKNMLLIIWSALQIAFTMPLLPFTIIGIASLCLRKFKRSM